MWSWDLSFAMLLTSKWPNNTFADEIMCLTAAWEILWWTWSKTYLKQWVGKSKWKKNHLLNEKHLSFDMTRFSPSCVFVGHPAHWTDSGLSAVVTNWMKASPCGTSTSNTQWGVNILSDALKFEIQLSHTSTNSYEYGMQTFLHRNEVNLLNWLFSFW